VSLVLRQSSILALLEQVSLQISQFTVLHGDVEDTLGRKPSV
jgi:hypothetical protein